MRDWIKQLFSDMNDEADEMAFLSVAAVLALVFNSVYSVMHGQAFDAQAFGVGTGALIGAAAAGMGYKSRQETPPAAPK